MKRNLEERDPQWLYQGTSGRYLSPPKTIIDKKPSFLCAQPI